MNSRIIQARKDGMGLELTQLFDGLTFKLRDEDGNLIFLTVYELRRLTSLAEKAYAERIEVTT